jgi:hypothetical protein
MDRKDLMRLIAVATGVTLASPGFTAPKADHGQSAIEHAQPQGYAKSGNPKAAGGPDNPGVGNPFNAY